MDYKSIIGFSKSKKKQIKNPTSNIKKNTVLDEIKREINEWSHNHLQQKDGVNLLAEED